MRKKTKIGLIAALLAVLAGTALFCACGSDPAYYGVYSSGTSTRCASLAVNKDGFYLGDEGNHYQYQYDYTYSDGSLNVDTLGTVYCFENDQVLCMLRYAAASFDVRDGFFNQTFWFQTGGEINGKMEFNSDGTYSILQLVAPVSGEYGTYTLNSGVLIFHVDTITGSALADTVYEEGSQHYGYVSESGTFYVTAFVKNASQFAGGNTGGNTNTPETPEPTPSTYTLTYTATEGGRIVGSPTQTVSAGANGDSVMAIANEGYEFIGWSDGEKSAERLDENVTENISVSAQFAKIPEYTLNYSAQRGGYIRGDALQTVLRGEDGTAVTAVAEAGYEFIGWSDGVQSAERLDENVTENISVSAQFAKIPEYTLNYSAQTGGYIRGNALQTVLLGENGTAVTAVAENGYEFVSWSDGIVSAERQEENVTANLTVTAHFEKIPEYTLSYSAQAGGFIRGNILQTVLRGEDGSSVTAVAENGYEFVGWSDGEQSAERAEEAVIANLAVTALFEKIPEYILSYSAQTGGYIRGDALQTVLRGENGTVIIAVAENGYEFIGWSDGVSSAERTDANILADLYVTAQFEKIPEYTLTYSAQTGGYIRGNISQTVLRGEDGSAVTAIAKAGYEFVGWSDGVQSAERLDKNVTENISASAQFAKIPEYTLSYSSQSGGYIQGDIEQTVLRGGAGSPVIAIAEEDYEFIGWSDGVQTAERKDINVMADITITAQFRELDLPAFAGGNGTQGNPYQINTVRHLRHMQQYPAAHYILTGNIVLTSVGQGQSNFTPLFDENTMFTGTFDGNGYTISNLTIYNTDTFYTGLFACIGEDGKVFDLTLENIRLQGTNYIGGVAGYALGAVTNCKVTGEIFNIALNSNDVFLGGIAGRAENELNGCTTEVTISAIEIKATAAYIGGVAGYFAYHRYLFALSLVSYSDLTITKSVDEATVYAGGVFGYSIKPLYLQECFAEGNVTVELLDGNSIAGGLIGYCHESSTLINCYALGNVSGSSYIGGLIGQMERQATLSNCYATGNVSSNNYGGGLIGYLIGGSRNVLTNCYATGDVTVKEQPSGAKHAGGLIGYGTSVDLTNCHAEGDVIVNETAGYYTHIGGLVGYFSSSSRTLINCYATGNISGNVSASCYAGGLVGNSGDNHDTLINCYAMGNINITVKVLNAQNNNSLVCTGGLVGRFNVGGGETVIQNSYSTSKIIYTGTATTTYLGGLVGYVYAQEVTLSNVHWLYFADSGIEYAVGYSSTLGIPTNIGSTKHADIAEFYDLADTLNEGLETPAWEHMGANTLPTLIQKENQTEEIAL